MESDFSQFRIFISSKCIEQSDGVLLGARDSSGSYTTYTVTHVLTDESVENLLNLLKDLSECSDRFGFLGFIQTKEGKELEQLERENYKHLQTFCDNWIVIEKSNEVTSFKIREKHREYSDDILVILYDCCEVMNSVFITGQNNELDETNSGNNTRTNLDMLVSHLEQYEDESSKYSYKGLESCRHGKDDTYRIFSVVGTLLTTLFQINLLGLTFGTVINSVVPFGKIVPATAKQLETRGKHITKALSTSSEHSPSLNKQRARDIISLHIFDVLLGIIVLVWLLQNDRPRFIADAVILWAEHVVTYLQELIQWMNGAPAGLKLNKQLNQLLGKFFMYHIFLWTGYLNILAPVFVTLVHMVAVTGILGFTTQLAMTRDLITMLTLHIYCFYVYAAKLYHLLIYTLTSLWRLFRGKKWNVIRERVDSASFDVDQLFIGTLLFTTLLFLLPTIGLYYVVFTALRLILLGIQGGLQQLVLIVNMIPVASLAQWITSPKTMSDRCKFTAIRRLPKATQYLTLEMQPASLVKICRILCRESATSARFDQSSLFRKLCTGEILYPWFEPGKS